MKIFVEKNSKYLLAAIVLIAAVLIFTGLTRADIQHDDATYSFRSVGYLDFMNSDKRQTTPIQWFDEIPWWGSLSFHDHPPLVFVIQYFFFNLFGISTFVARLPFALAGMGSVVALYFLGKELYTEKVGLLSSFLLAIFSYHTWASKIGYLEGFSTLLIILTLYFFIKGLKNKIFLYPFALALGLTILTKYTVAFILPVIFIYLLLRKRALLKNKTLYLAGLITLLIVLPLIIYNVQMFQERGHFDLQLSALFNQDTTQDWPGISRSLGGFNAIDFWLTFFNSYSIVIFLLLMLSLIYILLKFILNIKKQPHLLVILVLLFGFIQFSFIGNEVRFLSVLNPYWALLLAVIFFEVYKLVSNSISQQKIKKIGLAGVLLFAIGFEIFYNINTNLLHNSVGQRGKHYSQYRWEAGGFNELEDYFIQNGIFNNNNRLKINTIDEVRGDFSKIRGKDVLIYQHDLNWFSALWYFARYSIYFGAIIIPEGELANQLHPNEWTSYLRTIGVKNIYYISGKNDVVISSDFNLSVSEKIEQGFGAIERIEVQDIYNNNDELAFKIYKLTIN